MSLGALDATQHGSTAQEFGVQVFSFFIYLFISPRYSIPPQGYPSIKYFAPGASEPEEYDGGRTADAIVR